MYKNALKEDLIRVVEDLDGTVESTDTIAKLKTKIENSSTFESDPDFVKLLIQNCIDERVSRNEREETATHIGIREAEDWFRPIDLAKECDIYISSRNGSHKEIPITYGYTQDPFKNRSQNFKPKIKENYPQYLERENKKLLYMRKRNRRTTAQQVANQFLAASGKQISRKTFARRLRGGGLYARRPVVCVPLTRQHRTARLQWCREHHNWTEQDWACVLFSDEKNIQENERYPTCSIMVWAGIMINDRTRLHVVANGTMTSQRYIDEVLLPHVRVFRGAVGDKFVFMDDNATCHRTLTVKDRLDSEGIQRLVWLARSPDLNRIENVDALGEASCWSKLSSDKQEHPHPCTHRGMG
ncbi:transposable element Tcb2 transposase [Trichonephila clavipes]|nr:transposable element Tcb2 transposase [Trichonephila clavipes]